MATESFIGEIQMFGCNFAPRGWSFCNGQLVSIASNTALFSLLGTTYGGNGTTNFALPDLRSRTPVHQGQGPGLSIYDIGQKTGTETVTLLATEMPAHNHVASTTATQPCLNAGGNNETPVNAFPAPNPAAEVFSSTSNGNMGALSVTTTLANSGGGQPHDNMPPYLVVNFCIATQGVFPSRN
jgi:microcystin-dependent protein